MANWNSDRFTYDDDEEEEDEGFQKVRLISTELHI